MNQKDRLKFLQSQVDYYRQNLNCGPSRDWNFIAGLKQYYESEVRKVEKELGRQQ